ncbi:MAG: glycosyltransferase family 2 protein [Pseudomonadota bacterium]
MMQPDGHDDEESQVGDAPAVGDAKEPTLALPAVKSVVAIPTLNEAAYIRETLEQLRPQLGDGDKIVVADGGSDDRTVEIVREIAAEDARVTVVHNAARLQSAACNLVAAEAVGSFDVMIRADAHADYPDGFVSALVAAFRDTGADSVVVPMVALGKTPFQRAAAAAQNSVLGNGGAAHRRGASSGFVDHGHHALFKLAAYQKIGGYNAEFSHNEDFEFDHRLVRAGGKIWMCREASIGYWPRTSAIALAKQYLKHGRGRMRTIMLHKIRPKLRQVLPVFALLGSVGGLVLSVVAPVMLLLPISYVLLCCVWGGVLAIKARDTALLASGPAAIIMHLSWATGFILQGLRSVGRSRADDSLVATSEAKRG